MTKATFLGLAFRWSPCRIIVGSFLVILGLFAWHAAALAAQLTVIWTQSSADVTGTSIERSTGATGSFAEVETTGPGVTSFTDGSLADATTYCYRLRAFNGAGYSDYSSPPACGTTLQTFGLAVVKIGAGSGTVTSAPAGITCGPSCSGSFASGTVMNLTAAPTVGSAFTGWSGGGCSGTGTCVMTLTAATTVTA